MLNFIKSLFSSKREYTPNPALSPAQKFALATNAVLTEVNGDQHEWLHGNAPQKVVKEAVQAVLAEAWGVPDREALLTTLGWIEAEGHRKEYESIRALFERKGDYQRDASELLAGEPSAQSMSGEEMVSFRQKADAMSDEWRKHSSLWAWDFARAISLCRWGAAVGFLSDDEAWQRIMGYARVLQQKFGSWAELGDNYRVGFLFWSGGGDVDDVEGAIQTLLDAKDEHSPWKLCAWGTPL